MARLAVVDNDKLKNMQKKLHIRLFRQFVKNAGEKGSVPEQEELSWLG